MHHSKRGLASGEPHPSFRFNPNADAFTPKTSMQADGFSARQEMDEKDRPPFTKLTTTQKFRGPIHTVLTPLLSCLSTENPAGVWGRVLLFCNGGWGLLKWLGVQGKIYILILQFCQAKLNADSHLCTLHICPLNHYSSILNCMKELQDTRLLGCR